MPFEESQEHVLNPFNGGEASLDVGVLNPFNGGEASLEL